MTSTASKPPFTLTGGCLCTAIRYAIAYPAAATDWPPKRRSTCHCTQCRKSSGCLYSQGFTLPTSYISPPFTSNSSCKIYQILPRTHLTFCGECGSRLCVNEGLMGKQRDAEKDETYLFIGSLDEDVLRGYIGRVLAKPLYHGWMENAIPGFTDGVEGKKYQRDTGMPGP